MRRLQADELLRRPVVARGIRVGRVADVIFDPAATRVVGFDVLCGDGLHRFLPFPVPFAAREGLEVGSTLTLLDADELAFYLRHGRSLAAAAELRDARVRADGVVEAPDVAGGGAARC